MDAITLVLVSITILSFYLAYVKLMKEQKSSNGKIMPPGPPGVPLLGNVFFIRENDHQAYKELIKYGPLCTLRIGLKPMVILNTYEAVQEALVNQGDIFSGRPHSSLVDKVTRMGGVVFADGPVWKEHRRVMMRMLREFGVGKTVVEEIVKDEFSQLRERLAQNEVVHTPSLFAPVVSNVIGRLLFRERSGSEDPEFQKVIDGLHVVGTTSPTIFLPGVSWLRNLPLISRLLGDVEKFMNAWDDMHDYISGKLTKRSTELHAMEMMPKSVTEANDICDYLLIEKEKQESVNPGRHSFTDWQMMRDLLEIYGAGIDTTVTNLSWISLFLAVYPEVQKKAQEQIEEHIGFDRLPTMEDRAQVPYVVAVLDEILRYASIVTSGLPHRTLEDTELMGHFIPAGAIVQANLYGIHHDPKVWEKPDEFYPQHFLTPDGRYQPSKYLIPFSIGKRACVGEALGRTQLFIGMVTILQNFSLSLVKNGFTKEEILTGEIGLALKPKQHQILFTKLSR